MRRLDIYANNTKQRCLLMLPPLMLLAICTWALQEPFFVSFPEEQRQFLLISSRIVCLGLFTLAVAFMVPTFHRPLQLVTVSVIYCTLIACMPHYDPDILYNPVSCVLASMSALFTFLPHYDFEYQPEKRFKQRFISFCFALLLPFVSIVFILIVLRQIDFFILHTFDEMFGRSLLSAIYVPLYIVLQLVGCHDQIGSLVALHYDEQMVSAFVNAVLVTLFISLPVVVWIRSFYVHKYLLLFMNLLVVIAILTSSVGTCSSLILLMLIFFCPGAFILLLCSSVVCFFASLYMEVPSITHVANLFAPDVDLKDVHLLFAPQYFLFNMLALFFPIALLTFSLVVHREQIFERKRLQTTMSTGYLAHSDSPLELYFIALLRALGGLSNIVHFHDNNGEFTIWVRNTDMVSLYLLNSLLKEKALLYRFDKMYICHLGQRHTIIAKRLSRMLESSFGEEKADISIRASSSIRALTMAKTTDLL